MAGLDARLSLAAPVQRLVIQAHLDGERIVLPPPHRKRFLPLWVGYVGRRSAWVKRAHRARGCSRALSHTPAGMSTIIQGAVRRGKGAVWLQNGMSLSMNTAQPLCLSRRDGVVETADACLHTLARLCLADVCRLLACSGPRDEASEACGGAGLGRMMEVSRKKWKRRWPALTECHARVLRSTWSKIRRRLVFLPAQ